MKITIYTYHNYSNENLRETRNNLHNSLSDLSYVENLPSELKTYINTENPQIGNTNTRIVRCIKTIDEAIVIRFISAPTYTKKQVLDLAISVKDTFGGSDLQDYTSDKEVIDYVNKWL